MSLKRSAPKRKAPKYPLRREGGFRRFFSRVFDGEMSGEAKFFILLAVAVVIVCIYGASPPINKGEIFMAVVVVCGILYFWLENKRSA